MSTSRRIFLASTLGAAVTAAAAVTAVAQQVHQPRSRNPFGGVPETPELPSSNPHAMLKANQEDIKKDVARLTQLVAELQKGLDESDTKQVLSLDVIHKTEEIEKLAKQIRGLVRS